MQSPIKGNYKKHLKINLTFIKNKIILPCIFEIRKDYTVLIPLSVFMAYNSKFVFVLY